MSAKTRSPGAAFADLIGLTTEAPYEPVKDGQIVRKGGLLPYKKLVIANTGEIAGREATWEELEDLLALGRIDRGETVIIPRAWVDEFDFGYWDDADFAWTIPVSHLETGLHAIGLKRQEAGTFTRAQLVQAFGHCRPRAISTLDLPHVEWAGIALQFAKKVSDNPEYLAHYVDVDALQHLSTCQPTFYVSGRHLVLFLAFDRPVSIEALKPLEAAMKCLVELRHTALRTSYVRGGMIGIVLRDGSDLIIDVDSTINLIRLPGCRHHITGRLSVYENGAFFPQKTSSAAVCERSALRLRAVKALLLGIAFEQVMALFEAAERTLRDWVSAFNEQGIDGLIERTHPGRPRVIAEQQATYLSALIEEPAKAGEAHWTARKLHGWVRSNLDLEVSYTTVWRLFHERGFSLQVPRPWPDRQDEAAREVFRQKIATLLEDNDLEIWFQDEMGVEGDPRPCRR